MGRAVGGAEADLPLRAFRAGAGDQVFMEKSSGSRVAAVKLGSESTMNPTPFIETT
jgi:hypothetical protein